MTGFEPATPCTPCKCASQAALHPDRLDGKHSFELEFAFFEFFDGDVGAFLDDFFKGISWVDLCCVDIDSDRSCEGGSSAHSLDFEVSEKPLFLLGDVFEANEIIFNECFHRLGIVDLALYSSQGEGNILP